MAQYEIRCSDTDDDKLEMIRKNGKIRDLDVLFIFHNASEKIII
jgi:hypothetical protein